MIILSARYSLIHYFALVILAAIAVILFIYLVNNYPRLLYTGINISDMGGNKIRLIKRINCMLVSLATGNNW